MCNGKCKNCKNKQHEQTEEEFVLVEESKYLFNQEMYHHYKELYEVALQQLKFKSKNVDHLLSMLEEVVALLANNRPPMVIAKVIDNGIERHNIDLAINNSMICDGQTNFSDIIGNEYLDDEDYESDV